LILKKQRISVDEILEKRISNVSAEVHITGIAMCKNKLLLNDIRVQMMKFVFVMNAQTAFNKFIYIR
jgi:hypothetical protein